MEMQAVSSSQIEAIGFDNDRRQMAVKFKGHGGKPGNVYLYEGHDITLELYRRFLAADSKGKFFAANVKKNQKIVGRKAAS